MGRIRMEGTGGAPTEEGDVEALAIDLHCVTVTPVHGFFYCIFII